MKLESKHILPYLESRVKVQYNGIINGAELSKYDKEYFKDSDRIDFLFNEKDSEHYNPPKAIVGKKVGFIKEVGIYKDYEKYMVGVKSRGLKFFGSTPDFKLVLHPLQDLKSMFKDDDQWIDEFKEYVGIRGWCDIYDNAISHIEENFYTGINVMALPYQLMEWLISLHFDVFCLIPEGLAIDINTL